jgi:DNA-binding response OmpR family regulator
MMTCCRALIIEDEYFLAKELENALQSFGVKVVALVGDLDEALDHVARGGFEFAVVDDLRGREAFSIADELRRKRLPTHEISRHIKALH